MNRTRWVFIVIITVAILIVFGVLIAQLINNLLDQDGNAEGEASTALPSDAVLVTIASSNTKRNWLDQVVEDFNAAGFTTGAGNRIIAEVEHVTSGGSMNAILDGQLTPVGWSPGDPSWVEQINTTWQLRNNQAINSQDCAPTVYAPLGFAMWRPMAEALGWPDTPYWLGYDCRTGGRSPGLGYLWPA